MKKQPNARYQKSEQAILRSFEHLLLTEGFQEITTTQIIQESGVNRATFYAHYQDKYALLDAYEEAELEKLSQHLQLNLSELSKQENPMAVLKQSIGQSVDYLYEHRQIYAVLLASHGDEPFRKKLGEHIEGSWSDRDLTDQLILPAKYTSVVVTGVITSILELWLQEGCQEPTEKIVDMICQALAGIITAPSP